jgi:hypothetical protein
VVKLIVFVYRCSHHVVEFIGLELAIGESAVFEGSRCERKGNGRIAVGHVGLKFALSSHRETLGLVNQSSSSGLAAESGDG